jgi:hypothetical protein
VENERKGGNRPDSVFSKKVRAGKRRTYFFDVKETRSKDYFLTITESKKRQDDTYERFKIFIYKEDFNKFIETLTETVDHVKQVLMPDFDFDAFNRREEFSEQNYNSSPMNTEASVNTPETSEETKIPEEEVQSELPPPPPVSNEDDLKW